MRAQKIEALTGVRMEKFEAEADTVLLLAERVSDAQRLATMQMKESDALGGKKGGKRGRAAEEDESGLARSGRPKGGPKGGRGRR